MWAAVSLDSKVLVLDIEGTDSKERGDQRKKFEQTTCLLALALADVVILNMWTTDIGRFDASNLGLLRVIFEVNLKLFDKKHTKKLLFVLRDYSVRDNNFEKIKQTLESDMAKIWSEIKRPEKYLSSSLTDFFSFEYCALPSPKFESQAF